MTNAEGVGVGGQLQAVTGEKGGNIGVSRRHRSGATKVTVG
jgi:hypothetical protein